MLNQYEATKWLNKKKSRDSRGESLLMRPWVALLRTIFGYTRHTRDCYLTSRRSAKPLFPLGSTAVGEAVRRQLPGYWRALFLRVILSQLDSYIWMSGNILRIPLSDGSYSKQSANWLSKEYWR